MKTVKMRINRHKSIIMSHIHNFSITVWRYSDSAHITVGDSKNLLPYRAGLDIDSGMKSVVSQFSESGGKQIRLLSRRIRILRIDILG